MATVPLSPVVTLSRAVVPPTALPNVVLSVSSTASDCTPSAAPSTVPRNEIPTPASVTLAASVTVSP